jgi:hypothetical protein
VVLSNLLVVRPDLPLKRVKQLIDSTCEPGKLGYGPPGPDGSPKHDDGGIPPAENHARLILDRRDGHLGRACYFDLPMP